MNRMHARSIVLALFLVVPGLSAGDPTGADSLAAAYLSVADDLRDNVFGAPIHVRSEDREDLLTADVYGIVDRPFREVREALSDGAAWCEFLPLSPNVKSCVHRTEQPLLTLYVGRKFYEPPEDVYRLDYRFRLDALEDRYLAVSLRSDTGPMGTRDYRIRLEAMPLDGGTLLRLRSSYRSSFMSRLATTAYLSTLGRGKLGFSVIGVSESGKPVRVQGVRGIVERNAMRYFLALETFLDTRDLPTQRRFETRIAYWFDQTERYRQLYEMPRDEYLDAKRRERQDQLRLQEHVTAGRHPVGVAAAGG